MSEKGADNVPDTTPSADNNNDNSNANNGNNNNQNNNNGNMNRKNRNNNRSRTNTYVSNHPKDWKGDCNDIGVTLGIKTEKLNTQTSVDGLLEKLESYVKKNLDYYEDVLCLITDGKDPTKKLDDERKNLLTPDQKSKVAAGDVIELALMKDVISRYGNRQVALKKNIGKLYELVWGQCTTSVKTLIKGETDYDDNKKKNNVKWLIEQLRRITSGVDGEADAVDVYFQALWEWTHVRQHENESEDMYQKRIDTLTQNLILAGGEDVLYPRKLLPTTISDVDKPKTEEKNALKDRVLAMHLLCRSDTKKHGQTVNELRKAKDVGRDEWPITKPAAFKLLVKRANVLQVNNRTGQNNNPNRNNRRF